MQTHTNGTAARAPVALVPTIEQPDPAADLDALEDAIGTLDTTLRVISESRTQAADAELLMERIEAGHVLSIEGGNAEQRKARLTLALADDARYEQARTDYRTARDDLADRERQVQVCKERIRLLRLAVESRIAGQRV